MMKIDLFGNIIKEEEVFEAKVSKPSPFGFIDNIAKKNYPTSMEGYAPYITNLAFSQRKDTIFFANEMNKYHALGEKAQFDFYFHALPKRNLFAKWAKAEKAEALPAIKEYFKVGNRVATEYLKTLKKEELETITEWFKNFKGGK